MYTPKYDDNGNVLTGHNSRCGGGNGARRRICPCRDAQPPPPPPPPPPSPLPPPGQGCWGEAPAGDHWCGGSHPGQALYTQQSGSVTGVDAEAYVWEKKGLGWRFCGLTEDECKAACSGIGACAEIVRSNNGCCYPAASRCIGTQRTKDRKLILTSCQAAPPPPPSPPVPHAVWTGHSSLPSIAIADAELHAAFLSRCKDTCLDTTDCIGFVEAGCDQAGCPICEFKSVISAGSYVVPDSHTYVWLDGSSRAFRASSVKGGIVAILDAAKVDSSYDDYDDGMATAAGEGAALPQPDAGYQVDETGKFTFNAAEVAAGISAAVLSGILIGNLLVLALVRCRVRIIAHRTLPRKAAPSAQLSDLAVEERSIPPQPDGSGGRQQLSQ